MKPEKRSLAVWWTLAILLAFIFSLSCNFQNPLDDFEVRVNFSPVSVVVSGQILNASTSSPIEGRSIRVEITGADNASVVDLTGSAETNFEIDNGFLTFGISENVIPSQNSPIKITVVTHADGYLSSSVPLSIDDTTAVQFQVNMVEVTNPPAGVVATRNSGGQADAIGAVTSTIITQTNPEPSTQGSATVTVPQSTVIRDANGTPLTGQLTTTVAYHNNQSAESMESFPGGFSVTLSQDQNGQQDEAIFVTGGFVSVEINDASGKSAKTFDSPIEISAEIPGGTINPETGLPIRNGDVIDVWSYDTDTGAWKHEGKGTAAGPDANGNFAVTFQVTHLSYFNMDWSFNFRQGRACRSSRRVNLIGYDGRSGMRFRIVKIGGGFQRTKYHYRNDDFFVLRNVPSNTPVRIEAIYQRMIVGVIEINDLCNGGEVDMNLALPANNTIDISVDVKGYCANRPDVELRPTLPIYYRKLGDRRWIYAGTMVRGRLEVKGIEPNQTYEIRATYEGVTETVEYFIDASMTEIDFSVEIPPEYCN